MGCLEHQDIVEHKFKEYSSIWGISSFCKNVNNFLSGKNLTFSDCSNFIEENAFNFYKKMKHIGKHSDVLKM